MNHVCYDAECASDISTVRSKNIHYDKIYFQSNEYLNPLFQNFSVEGKDVFSVLASGDQMFLSYQEGAKSVDTFDINQLTYYYYYLRKWSILYFNEYYPPAKELFQSHQFLFDVFKKSDLFDEEDQDALNFWKEYTSNTLGYQNEELFYFSTNAGSNEIRDLTRLKEILKKNPLSFQPIDISKEFSITKKYDVIILSNILEYLYFMDTDFNQLKSNLNSLLKDDGVIICSHFMHRVGLEKDQFRDTFDYHEFPYYRKKSIIKNLDSPLGYSYTKKR